MAKVTVRRPKLLMNKMSPFKKVHHKICEQAENRTRYSWMRVKRLINGAIRATLLKLTTFISILPVYFCLLMPNNFDFLSLPSNNNKVMKHHHQ